MKEGVREREKQKEQEQEQEQERKRKRKRQKKTQGEKEGELKENREREIFSNKRKCSQQSVLIHSFKVFFELGNLSKYTVSVFGSNESAFFP